MVENSEIFSEMGGNRQRRTLIGDLNILFFKMKSCDYKTDSKLM